MPCFHVVHFLGSSSGASKQFNSFSEMSARLAPDKEMYLDGYRKVFKFVARVFDARGRLHHVVYDAPEKGNSHSDRQAKFLVYWIPNTYDK